MFCGRVGRDAGQLMLWFEPTGVDVNYLCGELFVPWARAPLLCRIIVLLGLYIN